MSRAYDAFLKEQAERQDKLLSMPQAFDEAVRVIEVLHEDVKVSQTELLLLREQIRMRESPRMRLKDWCFGGAIGATIALIFGLIVN